MSRGRRTLADYNPAVQGQILAALHPPKPSQPAQQPTPARAKAKAGVVIPPRQTSSVYPFTIFLSYRVPSLNTIGGQWGKVAANRTASSPEVAERVDWISAWAEYWSSDPRCKLVCWYERDQADGWPNGRISGTTGGGVPAEPGSLRAFASLAAGYTTEPPPDPDPTGLFVPGVVPPMTRIKWG